MATGLNICSMKTAGIMKNVFIITSTGCNQILFMIMCFIPRVLYFSMHRYDHGTFYPGQGDADPTYTGGQSAPGFNVNVAWNDDKMGDSEYLSAFHHILMPIAYEVYS